ncbi:MAG: MarR family transcriptional regulator [Oscillospiraceae bacterium]|nr:MarR family transcriptional regulator [Oscillospiraceae bacterium]
MLDEELLAVWLRLTSVIDNQRLAAAQDRALPFNEAMVCGLLAGAQEAGRCLTASDLCRQTRILKSQMNAILRSLEHKGVVSRQRSLTDRRLMELRLLPAGLALYRESHRRSIAIVDRLIDKMGEEQARALLPLLRQVADTFETIQ